MMTAWTAVLAAAGLVTVSHASLLNPPILPLIVRNPYLSTWLANAREEPWSRWPMFYTGSSIGFSALASVPETGTVYPLFGRAHDSLNNADEGYNISFPTYVGANYDASTTNLSYTIPNPSSSHAAPLELVLSFLSPITPSSTLRQSIPASYVTAFVKGSFDIDLYIDLNGQWVSGDRGSDIVWEFADTSSESSKSKLPALKIFKVKRKIEQLFTEIGDQAEWGTLHFSGPAEVDHEIGTSAVLRHGFANKGKLQNSTDNNFRPIMEEEPVFAFSKHFSLGVNHSAGSNDDSEVDSITEDKIVFTVAHIQDPVTQFASERGLTYMRPLWESYFSSDEELIGWHYDDFEHANALAHNYSAQLSYDAYKSGSDSYEDIVSLSARQVIGATSFSGTPDNPILFLKEISSNGNSQTVDVIFPAWPFFMYTNPRWLAYLLEPLIEHMLSGQYPNQYTMHDLGTHFPNLTGHADGNDEYMPVEECGDMLIMGLSLVNSLSASASGFATSIWSVLGEDSDFNGPGHEDISPFALPSARSAFKTSNEDQVVGLDNAWASSDPSIASSKARKWLGKSYPLWKQWTGYLVEYSLRPSNQLCTDDFAGWLALQTNLALKGIVGIKAMSELSNVMGLEKDAKYFKNVSETYIKSWEEYGMSRDYVKGKVGGRAKLAYDWYGSWTTLYSLYADAVLCFHPSITDSTDSSTSASKTSAFNSRINIAGVQAPLHLEDGEGNPLSPSKSTPDFIPHTLYQTQSEWYATVMQKYGLPLDSRHLYTKSDWEFQVAAVASPDVRAEILNRVSKWLNETTTDRPFTDLYKTIGDGGFPGPDFFARPVIGSHFAFLALERACGGGGLNTDAWKREES
ncbi:DUF1793-domain-containing protein [Polychaeton citri CBS 116435]|uniref:DUF1793-domain-containing protein n=1 Tax=Polychaeton citri CBS 116435 TaxID=1314669 RepID=A0A9P4UNI5_9PEZI|nr:DUF1793-domain-containing protein [Polychaeton citri CBS 116435]